MRRLILMVISVSIIAGCAGKLSYIPPTPPPNTQNSIIVNMTKNAVWKKIIPALASSYFVINNLDKDSGFINISYSGNPEKYIDCGEFDSYVKNARGERRYIFPGSTGYKEYEGMINGNLFFIKRKMDLDGRINIVIQELSSTKTLITVNTRYVVNKDIWVSNPQGQSQHMNESISFNTNGSSSFAQGGTTCYATGALEQEVLRSIGF